MAAPSSNAMKSRTAKPPSRIVTAEVSAPRVERTPSEFGQAVKVLRTRKGISQAVLARLAGVSPGYIGLIETGDRGQRPSMENVKRMAQAVDATVEETEALLRAAGHLDEGESMYPTGVPTTFMEFINNYKRFTKLQRGILRQLAESWGMKE